MTRIPAIATLAAGLVIAGLTPAVASAAPDGPCESWAFNDTNVFMIPNADPSVKLEFAGHGATVDGPAQLVEAGAHGSAGGSIHGSITTGNAFYLDFDAGTTMFNINGTVLPDGSVRATDHSGYDWVSSEPLTCLNNAASA